MNKDILLSELCNPSNTRREGPLINLEGKGLSVLQKLYSQCRKLWNSVQVSAVNTILFQNYVDALRGKVGI